MSTQLPLPATWAVVESRRDPRQRQADLQRELAAARLRIRETLDELADRYRIPRRDVTLAMEGYADDLLSEVVYSLQREIDREIEGETEP